MWNLIIRIKAIKYSHISIITDEYVRVGPDQLSLLLGGWTSRRGVVHRLLRHTNLLLTVSYLELLFPFISNT